MARDVGRRHRPLGDALSPAHWRHFPRPRLVDDPTGRIDLLADEQVDEQVDELVVGPSGVYVVVHTDRGRHGVAGTKAARTAAPRHCADAAGRFGEALAAVLPPRYQRSVRPLVCACGVSNAGLVVGAVPVLAADACRHTLVHAPRVLSTSEVQRVASLLQSVLLPQPGPETSRRAGRRLLRWSAGAAATAAAAAAVVTSGAAAGVGAAFGW